MAEAEFRLITTTSNNYGAYFYPQDPAFGDAQGIGAFNVDSGGWNFDQQQSLLQGGFAFAVILHEFGHAHGLAHPHDNGGGSDVMLGVFGPFDSYGVYDLNQGVYTVMSYNDAWPLHPDGPSPFTAAGVDNGWSGTLSAFDIAVLQQRYGVHAYATGNDVYQLKDVQAPALITRRSGTPAAPTRSAIPAIATPGSTSPPRPSTTARPAAASSPSSTTSRAATPSPTAW